MWNFVSNKVKRESFEDSSGKQISMLRHFRGELVASEVVPLNVPLVKGIVVKCEQDRGIVIIDRADIPKKVRILAWLPTFWFVPGAVSIVQLYFYLGCGKGEAESGRTPTAQLCGIHRCPLE